MYQMSDIFSEAFHPHNNLLKHPLEGLRLTKVKGLPGISQQVHLSDWAEAWTFCVQVQSSPPSITTSQFLQVVKGTGF